MKDGIIDPNGNHYTALYWEYSSPVGRRWNLDPKPNVSVSPYATFNNNPIWNIDPLGDTSIKGQLYEARSMKNATQLPEVTVSTKKKYVPEQDFLNNPLTAYNSKSEKGFRLSNSATVESLAKDFMANYQCLSCHNTIIVGGPLLNEVKNLNTVKKLFLQGINDLSSKNFAPGSYFKGRYRMSDLNGPDGDRMKLEVLEDLLNGKTFTDSRFFSAEFFLGSFDFSIRVGSDGKNIAITVYDSKTVQSATDGGKKLLHKLLPIDGLTTTYQRYFWSIPIEKVKEKYEEFMVDLYKSATK